MNTSKNYQLLQEFEQYCEKHPNERFWQALRNWSGATFIYYDANDSDGVQDTFYWEEKAGK